MGDFGECKSRSSVNDLEWRIEMKIFNVRLTPLILYVTTLITCLAIALPARAAVTVIPAPACATQQAAKYCNWTQEELISREQRVVDDATKNIKEIILPSLSRAVWVPTEGMDPTNKKAETYCASKLAALSEGRVRYFPSPKAKSSEIGFNQLRQQDEEIVKRVGCQQRGHHQLYDAVQAKRYLQSFNSYTSWLYEFPQGYTQLYLDPINGDISLDAVIDQCKGSIVLRDNKVSKDVKLLRQGPGFFTEQALGLVEIEGELFGIEGGALIMDQNSERWRWETYRPLMYATVPDLKVVSWTARVLALYPLNPPWREYYGQLKLPAGERAIGEGDSNSYYKPCLWNIRN